MNNKKILNRNLIYNIYFKYLVLIGGILLMVFPWFYFNYNNYNSITAGKEVREMQKYVMNPKDEDYKISYILNSTPYILNSFWFPQDMDFNCNLTPGDFLLVFINGIVLLFFGLSCYKNLRNKNIINVFYLNKHYLEFLSIIFVFFNFLIMVFITVFFDWNVLIGRFMYFSIIPLFIILYKRINELKLFLRKSLLFVLILSLVVFWLNFLISTTYLLKRQPNIISNLI